MSETELIIRGYIEKMWGEGRFDLVDVYVHDEYVSDGDKVGREFVRRNIVRFRAAFPDHAVEVLEMVVDGDQAAVLVRHTGMHLGEFGGIAATGLPMSMHESGFLHVRDGKVVSATWVSDGIGLRMQLGYLGRDFWTNPRSIPADDEILHLV